MAAIDLEWMEGQVGNLEEAEGDSPLDMAYEHHGYDSHRADSAEMNDLRWTQELNENTG